MSPIVYLNGEYVPLKQATISVMDRGFIFGDAVYEVIPVFNSKPFRAREHLRRLQNSLQQTYFDFVIDPDMFLGIFDELIEINGGGNFNLYLQISRGNQEIRHHKIPSAYQPTIYVRATPAEEIDYQQLAQGLRLVSAEDERWQRCHTKSTALIANILLYQEALDKGFDDALLIRNGFALESTSANLFIVLGGTLITPPLEKFILPGITRELVIELAKNHGVPVEERAIPVVQLTQAQEIWVTSSTREIRPVIELDGKPVGDGKAGSRWFELINYYREFKKTFGV